MIALPSTTRLIAGGATLVAILGGLWYFGHVRFSAGQENVRAEIRRALENQGRVNRRVSRETVAGYRAEIERLRNRPGVRRVVRVCAEPVGVPVAGAATGVDDPGAAGGELPTVAQRDIGPELYAEADRADALAAQLRALHEWIKRQHVE